jgi:hypothetical protein
LGIDERMVRKLFINGIAVRAGRGRYSLAESVQGYIEYVRKPAPISVEAALSREIAGGELQKLAAQHPRDWRRARRSGKHGDDLTSTQNCAVDTDEPV